MAEAAARTVTSVSSDALAELRAIRKSYGGVEVLKEARFSIGEGEIHGLVGENGAGKSTLVKILAGEVRRDDGEILWHGNPCALNSRAEARRLGISMIHQELNLAPHMTVAENIFLGHELETHSLLSPAREIGEAQKALDRLGFQLPAGIRVGRLRLAERQLVEIARAVVHSERLVIMDEPTSSLSAKEVDELFRVVRRLKSQGTAVIFVSHRLEELAAIVERVTVLRDGETVYEGEMPRRDFSPLIRAMVGRELKDFFPPARRQAKATALEARGLSRPRCFPARGFEEISLSVRQGEIVGLSGLIGAGRTELLEALFGISPADHGTLLIDGKESSIRRPEDAIREGLALITEDRKRSGLALGLPIYANISLANLRTLARRGILDLKAERDAAKDFLGRIRIRARSVLQKAGRLSGGNQQKVVLAKWLFCRARIFLFDEPTRGVDVGAKSEIYSLMQELAESGAAILMASSELPEILGMSDRVLVMRDGRIVKELVTAQTSQEEIMHFATLG